MSNTDSPSSDSHESTHSARNRPEPRLLIVLRDFGMGGAQRQAALIANGLNALSAASVEVWAFEPGRAVSRMLTPGIPTRVIHPGSDGPLLARARDMVRFLCTIRKARPDIILPFTDFPNRVVGAVWPLTGAAACVWNQRDEGREMTGRPLERRALRQCTWFIANSAVGRDHLVNQFGVPDNRISIIRNGVVRPTERTDRAAAKRDLGIDLETPVVTMVANIHGFKDHETLVRAWRLVLDDFPVHPLLLLAGRPGDTHSRIIELRSSLGLEQSIRLLGEVDDVSVTLSASDVAVFSSRKEGCPNAVLEAMAAGLPVIATDIVGTREALGSTYPFLTSPSDSRSMADAIRELLLSSVKRRDLGKRCCDRAESHFSPENTVRAYESLISDLLRSWRIRA